MRKKKRNSCLNSKKANAIFDTFTLTIILFMLSLFTIIGLVAFNMINTDIQADSDLDASTKLVVSDINTGYSNWFDNGFLMAFIILWIATLIASFMIDSHPIFFVVSLVLLIFILMLSVFIGNIYEEVTTSDELLIQATASFPITNWIMTHLLLISIIVGFSVLIVLYSKLK